MQLGMPGRFVRKPAGKNFRVAIVVSRFNGSLTSRLLDGATACLRENGVPDKQVDIVHCPGAFEIPQVALLLAKTRRYHAVVCLGCVIRGETPHFEYVARAAADGIQYAAQTSGVPMSFGVLTTDTLEQAMKRSGAREQNKGWEAAMSAMEMAGVFATVKRKQKK